MVISARCNCNFTETALHNGLFTCWNSPSEVTYRATIVGTFNTSQLVGYIEEWVMAKRPFVKIGRVGLRVYQNCPVRIVSLEDDPECPDAVPVAGPAVIASSDPDVIQCLNNCLLSVKGEPLRRSP